MEKNFRSNYYEKVGFKSIDIKKSLETILSEEVIDKAKLAQFVLKYEVPAQFRLKVWLVLLNIHPCHKAAFNFVWQQRCDQYNVLIQSLKTMRSLLPDDSCDVDIARRHKMSAMLAVEENRLPWMECSDSLSGTVTNNRRDEPVRAGDDDFDVVFNLVHESQLGECDEEVYWLCRNMYKTLQQRKSLIRAQIKEVESYVARNDAALSLHLEEAGVWKWPPTSPVIPGLLRLAFSGIFQSESVIRIWDKIVAGCAMCEVFVLADLLLFHRSPLLSTPANSAIEKLDNLSREVPLINQHAIIDRALESWQMEFGGVLQPNLTIPVLATSFATNPNSSTALTGSSAPTELKHKISNANQSTASKALLQRKLSNIVKI